MSTIQLQKWLAAHPSEHDWLISNKATNNFAASLFAYLTQRGSLTEKQLIAVQRNLPAEHFDVLDLEDEAIAEEMGMYCTPYNPEEDI